MKFRERFGTAASLLYAGFGVLLGLILILAALNVSQLYQIRTDYLERQQLNAELFDLAEQLNIDLLRMQVGTRGFIVTGNESALESYRQGRQQFLRNITEIRELNEEENLVSTAVIDSLRNEYETLVSSMEDQIETRREDGADAEGLNISQTQEQAEQAEEILAQLEEEAQEGRDSAVEAIRSSILVSVVVGVIAFIVGAVAFAMVRNGLIKSLRGLRGRITAATHALEKREVADDDRMIRRIVLAKLSGLGYAVEEAKDGQEALERLEDGAVLDLLITDQLMPRMNGLQLIRAIRGNPDPEKANLPVIVLTSKGGEQDVIEGLEAGLDDYVIKPFSPDELAARVRTVLWRARRAPN